MATEDMERESQQRFWKQHSVKPSLESMMLDSRAKQIDEQDRPEILAALGSLENKHILELGCGIGRLTGEIAKQAAHITACDFMENLVGENQKRHSYLSNISFQTLDVTQAEFQEASFDVVFSNWLLMYLSDSEVETFFNKALKWLKPNGVLFFRESCYRQSGDVQRDENPTHYRDVVSYFVLLDKIIEHTAEGKHFRFKLMNCANLATYVKVKGNYGQIYWKLIKTEKDPNHVEYRHFLDHVQYTKNGILRYEKLFGSGFVSTGGIETTKEIVARLNLKPQQFVLDVGCGVGGGDFYLAQTYGATVLGIDLSVNMVAIALERACTGFYNAGAGNVIFEVADCTTRSFEEGTFDVVYSRDTILHIHEKPSLFKNMFRWLKPGGKILITDYCRSAGPHSSQFLSYIKQRDYDLHTVSEYGQMLKDAGFVDVVAEDTTESMFLTSLEREVKKAYDLKEEFLKEFKLEDFESVVKGWEDKIIRTKAGEQRWGLFYGNKPF